MLRDLIQSELGSVCLGISDEQMSQVKRKNLESRFNLGRGQGERGGRGERIDGLGTTEDV